LEVCVPNWKERYSALACETDSIKLLQLLSEAETAILARVHELEKDPCGLGEREELANALSGLRVVKNAKLGSSSDANFKRL
jgi:hypothetical protein